MLDNNKLFKFEKYENYIPMSLSPEFNLDSFKVHKCQLDKGCPNDYHICPYYHKSADGDEQRRPPSLFGYKGTFGELCFDKRKRKYYPNKCEFGIFCQFLHSKNEYNYHPDHFRKEYKCQRQKIRGKCIYYKTCYGIHPKEENDNNVEEEEEEEEIDEEEIEDDEEIQKISGKVYSYVNIGKYIRCKDCQNISENGELCYFIDCGHFLCAKCFKKMNKEMYQKEKKEKNKNQVLVCPFCEKVLKKKGVVLVNFGKQ